jgi:hypothetical protein
MTVGTGRQSEGSASMLITSAPELETQLRLESRLSELRLSLVEHPVYSAVHDLPQLRLLMREHVFAVWDFMSLLKRMQQLVTCTSVPWTPSTDPQACRLVQEIVVGEECDDDGEGGYASHYDLYLRAMQELGADAWPIRQFVGQIERGVYWRQALPSAAILPGTRQFVNHTLTLVEQRQPHEIAAVFFHGREDLIPEMFARLMGSLTVQGSAVDRLRYYLERHVDLDGDRHGPLAAQLLERMCQRDPQRRVQALLAACQALEARIGLWDHILAALP